MSTAPFRPHDALRALLEQKVEFVIIGGIAVTVHGYERFTGDLDIVPEPSAPNLERLEAALAAIAEPGEAPFRPDAPHQVIETSAGRVHVVREVKGLPPFDGLLERSIEIEFAAEVVARVCSKHDLVAMKRAAGRPRDALDVMYLTEGEAESEA